MKEIFKEIEKIKRVFKNDAISIGLDCWDFGSSKKIIWKLWIAEKNVNKEFDTFLELKKFIKDLLPNEKKEKEKEEEFERYIEKN